MTACRQRDEAATGGRSYGLLTARCALACALVCLSSAPVAAEPAITPPSLTQFVEAELPPGTKRRDAVVVLWLTIDTAGTVTEIEIKEEAGSPFDEAAALAALGFRFTPALVDGAPVAVRVPFAYRFTVPKARGMFVPSRAERRDPEAVPGALLLGAVREKGTRTPLYGMLVRAVDPATGRSWDTITSGEGTYRLEGLPPGRIDLDVLGGGYEPASASVDIGAPGVPVEADPIYASPSSTGGYRTVIQGERPPAAATEILLTEEELTRTPGTFGDPTRVVASLPGVARSPFGLGYYVVRGANFENTGFLVDGHPVLYLYHLLGGPAVIHPEVVGELRFYPGGYPAEFGRYAGGIIALGTKQPPTDRWHLDVEVDVLKASALFTVPFDEGRGTVTASFRRSYYEAILPLVVDDVSLSYTDYMLRTTWEPDRDVRLALTVFGAEDAFEAASGDEDAGNGGEQDLALGFHRVVAAASWDVSSATTWTTSAAFEVDHTGGRRVSEDDDDLRVDLMGYGLQVRSWLSWAPVDGYEGQVGVDVLWALLQADLQVPSLPPLGDPRPPQFDPITVNFAFDGPYLSVAPWISADWEAAPGLRFLPGVRFTVDRYAGGSHLTLDPKLAVRWQVHPAWTIKGMGALAHQAPPVFQVEEPYGDPDIEPIRALQSSLGLEWRPVDGWEITVEGFFNYFDNIARAADRFEAEDGTVQRASFASDVEGRAYGLEVLIRKQLGGFVYGWLSYTLSRTERLFPPDDWRLSTLDQTHVLNLAWSFLLGDGWSIGSRFTLTSGTPVYEPIGARYDADRDRYQPIFSATADRLPVFHRLDLRVDKSWRFDTWILGAYIDVQNVYNAQNPESRRYSFDFRTVSDGLGVPILPTLGVRATF